MIWLTIIISVVVSSIVSYLITYILFKKYVKKVGMMNSEWLEEVKQTTIDIIKRSKS